MILYKFNLYKYEGRFYILTIENDSSLVRSEMLRGAYMFVSIEIARSWDCTPYSIGYGVNGREPLVISNPYIYKGKRPSFRSASCAFYNFLDIRIFLRCIYIYTCVCTHTHITHNHKCLPTFEIANLSYRYVSVYVYTIKYLPDTCYHSWML